MYARNGNPNQHWLEEKIAALHEADDSIVLASGVAALHALFWTLLESGDRVVYPNVSYMAVYRMFHELFNLFHSPPHASLTMHPDTSVTVPVPSPLIRS